MKLIPESEEARAKAEFHCQVAAIIEAGGDCFLFDGSPYKSDKPCSGPREYGGVNCHGCPLYQDFYRAANDYEEQGIPWGEAVKYAAFFLGISDEDPDEIEKPKPKARAEPEAGAQLSIFDMMED